MHTNWSAFGKPLGRQVTVNSPASGKARFEPTIRQTEGKFSAINLGTNSL